MNATENEIVRQWLDGHWEEFCDWWRSKTKDASQIERVAYDSERHTGVMMVMEYQGVRKIIQVTPASLIEHLSALDEAIRQRCIAAAAAAEGAASDANTQGAYAEQQGDRVDALITEITTLKQRVAAQGNTAEQQGVDAENLRIEIQEWFDEVEQWAEDAASEESQRETAERVRISNENTRQSNEATRVSHENARETSELLRQGSEDDREAAELQRIRQESSREAAEVLRQQHEEARLDGNYRQNTTTGKWERLNQRTGNWEDTGNYWVGSLLAYRFYTDPATGRIHVVKNSADGVSFFIENGRLKCRYID